MATYNTGATWTLGNSPHSTAFTGTVPAGVLTGDVMLVTVEVFTWPGGTPAFSAPTSGGGSWAQIGTTLHAVQSGPFDCYGMMFWRVATASDPGSTFSMNNSAGTPGSTDGFWWSATFDSYTGFYTAAPIGNFNTVNAQNTPFAAPSSSTSAANSWAITTAPIACAGSGTITAEPGTLRHNANVSGIACASSDSNGSVGAAGTAIGGGTNWNTSGGTGGSGMGFTVELRTQAVASTVVGVTPPRIPHPRFLDLLLEEAYQRADWQAQGVASLQAQHWRLMDGQSGRPGTGSAGTAPPATATSNGATAIVNGLSFYVTEGGKWFEGYWYYCCASGQSTSPAKFALWSVTTSNYGSSTVVPGSVVTSGTLTAAAWNWVPLPQPVQLSLYGVYTAAAGVPASAGYPDTASQFGSGNPYAAGITSGPLKAFSTAGGGNPAPGGLNFQGLTVAGTDPSLSLPTGSSENSNNLWLDVQVTNTPPAGYSGSYRLWPNMTDADPSTSADSPVNYVIGTEILIDRPVYVNRIWYYMPSGTAQFATSADIWNVRNGVRAATQGAPTWRQASGAPATFASGQNGSSAQWAWCDLPGPVYLPAGDYYVTVYDGNGSPDGWGAKRPGYWQAYAQAPDGTWQHSPPGVDGIRTGPLYAPTTPRASDIQDYENNSAIEPGQSIFAVGPPNQFPNRYVGGSSGGGTGPNLFQNYWVDLEVTPAAAWTPDEPNLPQQLPHPLFTRLLEVAGYRIDGGPPPASATPAALADTGAGADALTVNVPAALADSGTGTDGLAVSSAAPLADSGTGADAITAGTGTPVPLADSGTGDGAITATAAAPLADAGAGSDAITTAATVALADTGTGADSITAGAAVPVGLTDAGTGTDTLAASQPVALADAGTGTDAVTLAALAALADTAAAAGLLAAAAQLGLADAGQGDGTLSVPPPFTAGVLTASDAPAGVLTATDQRTGGPG